MPPSADQHQKETDMPAHLAAAAAATVILVHGAFADGSSWSKVIARLQAKSIDVVAVQNPLSSLADDVAATNRAIAEAKGPVILVGHSWAGAVITQAGDDPKVKALVYVAAFAPDVGMSVNDLGKGAPPLPWQKTVIVSKDGYITLPPESIAVNFAQDLPKREAWIVAATQGPTATRAFDDKLSIAAWHDKPCWYVVAKRDRMIAPDAERVMARAIKAHVIEIDSNHTVMLSHAAELTSVIEDALASTTPPQMAHAQ
jgi:pimeloyl-ACP methyl ester carboxylesterase